MEHFGYSLIDANAKEVQFFGNIKGQCPQVPAVLVLPNGDQVHCAVVGDTYGGYRFVQRMLIDTPPSPWHRLTGETVTFDGINVVVSYAYEAAPTLVPITITPRQARLVLHGASLLDPVEAAVKAAGGATQITWEYATQIDRNAPLISALSESLGLKSAQVDALFRTASTL